MKRNLKILWDKGKADRINVTAGTHLESLRLTWEFPCNPHFHLSTIPWTLSILRHTHHVAHCHLWSCLALLNLFISIARGTSQATRMWRMGQERGAWEGDSFIFKITQTLYLKLKLKRNPQKTNQEDWQRRKQHSPLVLANMGHRLCVRFYASIYRKG